MLNVDFSTTSGESKGYLLLNLKSNWKFSPSYNVPTTPAMWIFHLKKKNILQWKYLCNWFKLNVLTVLSFVLHSLYQPERLEEVLLLKTSVLFGVSSVNKINGKLLDLTNLVGIERENEESVNSLKLSIWRIVWRMTPQNYRKLNFRQSICNSLFGPATIYAAIRMWNFMTYGYINFIQVGSDDWRFVKPPFGPTEKYLCWYV